jgi:DNA polymerase-3 subunit epsilon
VRYLYCDTETTDRYPGQICQLSYILDSTTEPLAVAKNFFFSVDQISPGAARVNGMSVEGLGRLSGGRRFADHLAEIEADLRWADRFVAHNASFDARFLDAELRRAGSRVRVPELYCTMKDLGAELGFHRYPKLSKLTGRLGITDGQIQAALDYLFDARGASAHDARYDVAAVYLICKKARIDG